MNRESVRRSRLRRRSAGVSGTRPEAGNVGRGDCGNGIGVSIRFDMVASVRVLEMRVQSACRLFAARRLHGAGGMLRRKLLLGLGSLIALFAVLAIGAVVLLERLLERLDESRAVTTAYIARLHDLGGLVIDIETRMVLAREAGGRPRSEDLRRGAGEIRLSLERLLAEDLDWPADSPGPAIRDRLGDNLPILADELGSLADALDRGEEVELGHELLAEQGAMQADILALTRNARALASSRQVEITGYFRWVVLGIAVAAIVVVNISVLVVLRITGMVLRPVDLLRRASGEWARERFDYRVPTDLPGEFGLLAATYNHLAEQLAANEQRKVETLHQAARTLSHELNNALAIIELQVQLLHRRADAAAELPDRLARIRSCLARMNGTIEALQHVRRIVLTDYVPGQKMLDLPRSVGVVSGPEETPTA